MSETHCRHFNIAMHRFDPIQLPSMYGLLLVAQASRGDTALVKSGVQSLKQVCFRLL